MTRREFCRPALGAPTLALFLEGPAKGIQGQGPANPRGVNYMLRYFIRTETAQQQTDALIAYCHQNHIRHLILFSDDNYCMGWNLLTLAEAKARVEGLKPVFQQLRQAGFHTSINMMTTIGHSDFGRDESGRFSWQLMVGDDGVKSHTAPCPLDPKWKSYIGELYGYFAQLEPEIIYIDDDFRYRNHRPVSWGCFCPLHLQEMGKRTGKYLEREELVRRILTAEPQPTAEREQWLKLCGDSFLEAVRIISDVVKETSPRTHMGLMCGGPEVHAAEGWRWDDMVSAMSVSGNQPVLRPSYASYEEPAYRDVAADLAPMRKLQTLLAGKMRFTPELENFSYTQFSKSAQLTRLQIALSIFSIPPDLTLNIHHYVETQLDDVPEHTKVLHDSFDYFSGIVAWATECQKERGLQILWGDRFPLHRKVDEARMTALPVPNCWEGTMDLLGFATTFYPDKVKLAGKSYFEERTDEEIRALLKEKCLMDGDAANHLVERGFGREVGLKSCKPAGGTSYEQFVSKDFAPNFLNREEEVSVNAEKYGLDLMEGTILVTRMFGPEASFSVPGMTLFENASGGRSGIIPLSGLHGDLYEVAFRGWKRQYALKKMLEWINRGPLPLFVEGAANVLPLRRDGERAVLIGVANLSADPILQVVLQLAPPFEGKPVTEYLTPEGMCKPIEVETRLTDGYLRLRIPVRVPPVELACFRLTKA
jgi:hypothetical protein